MSRYSNPSFRYFSVYPHREVGGKTLIIPEQELQMEFPLTYDYLAQFKSELVSLRKRFKTPVDQWYRLHRPRDLSLFESSRIATPEISLGCSMTIVKGGVYNNTKVYSIRFLPDRPEDMRYWLGLLNSNLMWWFISTTGYVLRNGYYTFKTAFLRPFPARTVDPSDHHEKDTHDRIVTRVQELLEHQQPSTTLTPQEEIRRCRDIEAAEHVINETVYDLYGLTRDEIRMVERSSVLASLNKDEENE